MRALKLAVVGLIGFLALAQAFRIDKSNPPVEADLSAAPAVKQR